MWVWLYCIVKTLFLKDFAFKWRSSQSTYLLPHECSFPSYNLFKLFSRRINQWDLQGPEFLRPLLVVVSEHRHYSLRLLNPVAHLASASNYYMYVVPSWEGVGS